MSDFNLTTKDRNGDVPEQALVGRLFRHNGNGKLYLVSGFSWIGDTDEWGVDHFEKGLGGQAVSCVRSYKNFCGKLENGKPRFTEM